MRANYAVVLSMQNAQPYLNGIVSLDTGEFFLENSDGNKAGKCKFLAWFGEFKVHFCKMIDV